jgi:hypothetical protein
MRLIATTTITVTLPPTYSLQIITCNYYHEDSTFSPYMGEKKNTRNLRTDGPFFYGSLLAGSCIYLKFLDTYQYLIFSSTSEIALRGVTSNLLLNFLHLPFLQDCISFALQNICFCCMQNCVLFVCFNSVLKFRCLVYYKKNSLSVSRSGLSLFL